MTEYNFMYNRLSMPKFFTSQWLKVKAFTDEIDNLNHRGIRIEDKTVLSAMDRVFENISEEETVDGVSVNTLKRGYEMLQKAVQISEMDDNWFIKKFGQIYDQVISLRHNDDYVVNAKMMDKFLDLVNFFLHHTEEDDKVEIERTEPKHGFGGVTATFLVMTLRGDDVTEFCRVLKCCSAVSIDSCEDGACISCTVPDIFVRKDLA